MIRNDFKPCRHWAQSSEIIKKNYKNDKGRFQTLKTFSHRKQNVGITQMKRDDFTPQLPVDQPFYPIPAGSCCSKQWQPLRTRRNRLSTGSLVLKSPLMKNSDWSQTGSCAQFVRALVELTTKMYNWLNVRVIRQLVEIKNRLTSINQMLAFSPTSGAKPSFTLWPLLCYSKLFHKLRTVAFRPCLK